MLDHLSDAEIVRWRDKLAALEDLPAVDEDFLPMCAPSQAPGGSI
jgi:hypothetical protein